MDKNHFEFVIVGGGIAGVSCAEMLSSLCPGEPVLLLTASPLIKAITNYKKVSKTLEEFDVEEKPMMSVQEDCPNVTVVHTVVTDLNSAQHILKTNEGHEYTYRKLCICTGGKPKVIADDNARVLGIRDTESVKEFQKHLSNAKRIVVVGNGGIATELVYEVEGCEVIWAIKDKSISHTFVDAGAAEFFLPELNKEKDVTETPSKRLKYTIDDEDKTMEDRNKTLGGALGPDWATNLSMHGSEKCTHSVHVEYRVEVRSLLSAEQFKSSQKTESLVEKFSMESGSWPVYVELTNDRVYGCDLVVSATGVIPNTTPFMDNNKFDIAEDGGLKVNDKMETSVADIYAAGDVCTACWETSAHWMQMRLWTQARQMGAYSAQCMVANSKKEDITLDFCFEMFAHVTKFFNYKVILLGKFNAQGLEGNHELLLRVTKGKEYVKAVLKDGYMQGAVLIGETDLEETFENLILNRIDLTPFKDDLLDPNIDIEDFFD